MCYLVRSSMKRPGERTLGVSETSGGANAFEAIWAWPAWISATARHSAAWFGPPPVAGHADAEQFTATRKPSASLNNRF